jgi:hypothetical protein
VHRIRTILGTLIVWFAVGVFWYFATRNFHLTQRLAVIVTASLVSAYAAAVYINHLVLIPRFWRHRRWPAYWGTLLSVMIVLTSVALTVIRVSHIRALGPDPNPNGLYNHFAIDFMGMVAHVFVAAIVVWLCHRSKKEVLT